MGTVLREIEIEAPPSEVGGTWPHFTHWILTGHSKLACDEFACVSAVDTGNVAFEPVNGGGSTRVVFRLDVADESPGPTREELEHHVTHDLLVFKDYVERGGAEVGRPSHVEVTAAHLSKGRKVDDASHEKAETSDKKTGAPHMFP